MTTATLPRSATAPRPTAPRGPVFLDAPVLREAPVRSWSPYDAPVHEGSAASRMDELVYAATLPVGNSAYVVASIVGACALAIGTTIVLAWDQRH